MRLKVAVFPGAANLPFWLMECCEIRYINSRDEQIHAIQSGLADIIHTAPDNLLLDDAKGLVPFISGSVGPLVLVEGRVQGSPVLGVDNPKSGFGRLADRWLEQNRPNCNYEVKSIGGTQGRFMALQDGAISLAVMHPPFTQFCEQAGFLILGRVDEGIATLIGACRSECAGSEEIHEYRRQYRAALNQLSGDDGNAIAVELLSEHTALQPDIIREVAQIMRTEIIAAGVELNAPAL